MEIDRTAAVPPSRLIPPDSGAVPPAAGPADAIERRDRIELSNAAREVGQQPAGDREAKLLALRAQIEAGTYRVDADGVARRIVARDDL